MGPYPQLRRIALIGCDVVRRTMFVGPRPYPFGDAVLRARGDAVHLKLDLLAAVEAPGQEPVERRPGFG